ncbi:hypothetical protein OIO90_001610 [Microbotryomycetes sp. JL221]|nr:hypothetical protein OIO90_001610 [Microbotryomycetes sp. JL221]
MATSRTATAARRLAHIRLLSTSAAPALKPVYIVAAARTPVGSFHGALSTVPATELGAAAVRGALAQAKVDPNQVEEVYMGMVLQANAGQAPARQVALKAGCPDTTEATTINKVCASGMKAAMLAAQNIQTGQRHLMVAGGMESMSQAPMYVTKKPATFGHGQLLDALVRDGLSDAYNGSAMGVCGDKTAKDHNISREAQDEYAIGSYKKAADAWASGKFKAEVVPFTLKDKKGKETVVNEDEEFRNVKLEKIPTLRPVFAKDGTITAANASTLNDGASALVLASQEKVDELKLKPLARIVSFADAACKPIDFPIAPAKAIPMALDKAGLSVGDVAKFEINEAFAAVAIVNKMLLDIPADKLNVNGGAVALGHALGSSGSRIIVSLLHDLKSGEFGVAGVCNGGGAASAIVVEKM